MTKPYDYRTVRYIELYFYSSAMGRKMIDRSVVEMPEGHTDVSQVVLGGDNFGFRITESKVHIDDDGLIFHSGDFQATQLFMEAGDWEIRTPEEVYALNPEAATLPFDLPEGVLMLYWPEDMMTFATMLPPYSMERGEVITESMIVWQRSLVAYWVAEGG